MLDKKKAKLRRQQEAATDKRFRYSIRKFNVGVASVAIAAFMFLGGGAVVSADDTAVSEPQTAASSTGDSSSTTSEAPTATSTEATSTASEASTSSESAATSTEATSTASEASTSSEAATSESATTSTEATSEATSTTASTASETASNTASTPTTVEEAKTVLEQVISEAEVLAQEASRQAASSTEDATALQTASEATKLVATEATVTFNNALATLDEVNAQITAVRTNVEALALELRKYYPNGDIVALMNTTTSATTTTSLDVTNPNSVAYAQQGVWEIPDPVKAANSGLPVADQPATIQEADKNYPAGYSGDQDANRDTFLIYNLDTINGYGDGNNFNDWVGKNYYITFSVSTDKAEREANDVVYAKLVEKTANGDNVVNTIQLKPGVKNNFDELKVLEGNKEHNTTYSFLYTVQTTGGTTRNLSISNTNGTNQNTHLYNKLETAKVGTKYNSSTALVPGTTTQTTTYYVKENADTDRPREMLAKYTQKDGLVGDKFHIAGPIDFNNYELISSELPTVTSGILASDYTKGAQWVVLRGNYNEARLLTITDEDGSLQYQMYMLDPQNPNWANFYKNNMEKATIADLKDYFKLMFTSEVIAPGNKNTKEGLFEEKFYEANKLVLENTIVQVLDKNGDVLGTLSDDKTTINVPNGKNISVAKATDTMVTDVNGDLYTVNHLKVYKTDADGNYVDADGNILTPLKWRVDAPQRKVNGKDEIYPGYGTETPFTTDTIRVETGPWDKANMNEATESVWYYGWNYHTASDETRLTDSEAGKTAWDVGGLEMSMPNNNLKNEQHVRYWYSEKGGVEVHYVTSDGTVLTDFTAKDGSTVADKNVVVDHGDTDSAYDTTSVRYESITAADGTVYYYKEIDTTAANLHPVVDDTTDTDYRANEKIDAETGTIKTDTVKQLTYVYEKAGSVIVNYITEDGTPLSGTTNTGATTASTVDDTKDGKPGSTYDTTDLKPTTITTADGKTYELVPASTVGDETGTVEAGVTKEVTYVYKEVKGDVIVHYVDQDGNPISGTTDAGTTTASTVTDTPESSTGTPYDTTDLKPNTITTADGKVYRLVPAATQGNEKGDVVVGTTEITYVYELVEGDVIVHYVDTEGNTIASDVTDTPTSDTGTDYDTTDNKPEKIVNDETGDVYYYKEVKAGDNETGKVVEGTTEVTYIYEKAGSVNVNYVDTDGNPLIAPVADVTDGKPASDYDTLVDNKPETIATADGKLYRLVPAGTYNVGTVSDDNNLTAAGNGTATGVDSVTGTVEAGTTKEITYVYEEVKGDVVVEYYDTDGNVIATTVVDTPTSSTGTPYNTLDQKPATITAADGTVYYYKEVKSTSAAEDGTVVEGTTTVQYVYEKAGSVNVNYVDTDGNPIQAPVADETNEKAGTEYSTTDNKPTTITTADGKTYKLVPAGTYNVGTVGEGNNLTAAGNGTATGVDSETGAVEAGTTKEITYVYEEVKGNVVVNYITTDGTVIKQPVEDTPSSSTGTPYTTTDNKPTTITTEDGKTYRLVPSLTKGNETGDVVEGTTEVTYVYEEVKGDVVVEYYDTEGNLISGISDSGEAVDTKEVDTPSTSTGTAYNTDEDHKPNTITTADGTVYYYKEVKDTSASTTGEVVEGTTTVQYVYEKAGNVIVHYITEDGTVIKATVTDEENAEPGKSYTTTDNKPTTITTEDGTVYELIPTATIGNEDGSVEAGKTIEVTYVYRKVETPTPDVKTGSVVIRYVEAGNESNVLKDPVLDENAVVTGTKYDTTDEGDKPAEIVKDGVRYVLVPSKTTAVDPNGNPVTETGEVAEGTTVVTYKYQKVANWIPQIPATPENPTPVNPVIPYPFDPTNPDKPIDPTTPYPGGEVPSIPHVPGFTPVDPKTNEPLKPVDPTDPSKGYVPPTPDESGIDTPIPYVQNGNVVVNYVTEDGTVIKAPVQDETDAPAGKSYDTTDNKPNTITTEDGTTYELVRVEGSETGTVEGGKTTEVTYVYRKVETPTPDVKTGSVVIRYVEAGNESNVLKDPVLDENAVVTGTKYDTTDEGDKPAEIVKDGVRYVLVPSKTTAVDPNGNPVTETGEVAEGTTVVTYKYQKVANWIPQIPATPENPTPVNPVIPYPFDPTNPDKPIDPTTPYPGGEVPSIPHVPGFTPVDPKTNEPLKPVDPTDPSKGYVPPTPDESGIDTPIPYVQNGNVVVNYVTEDGTVIKAPVQDETDAPAGKSYDTTDNKPNTITTEDGTTYELVRVEGSETGTVEGGKTTEVTYVYRKVETPTPDVKTGSVVIRYVEAGNESNVLKDPVLDENAVVTGTKYDTTDEGDKPAEIVKDGVRYVLVPSKTTAVDPNGNPVTETGEVAEGTTVVTYKYQKVANWIPQIPATPENPTPVNPVIPYPFDPTNPDKPIDPTTPYPGGEVPSIPHVPGFTPVDPKTNEPLKPVDPTDPSKGYVPPTPDESGIDTPIPYVQNGNVVVNYVTEDGTVIKAPVQDEINAPAGKSYDTTDNKPNTITTEDGTVYELVRVEGSETGTVEGGKTTEVTYVYRKVETPAKKVVTNHVDEDGNPIAPQEEGTTPNKSIPEYEFTGKTVTDPDGNTTHIYRKVTKVVTNHVDEEGNPIAPQEEGTTPNKSIPGYEFTGKTITDENGNTTHIYRKVVTPVDPTDPVTPEDPTDPVTPVTPVDPKAPVQPGVPVKPETPAKPGVPAKPEAPAKPTYVAETLPNTGEDNSASVAAMGASMILASLGLAAKRRRKED